MEINYGTGNEVVDIVGKLNISGNVIPDAWLNTIKLVNGKPFMNAILILSDIVYWHRPTEVRDEFTGNIVSYKTKFSGDMLQRSHRQFEMRFGMSEKQVRFAIQALEEIGVIRREFRKLVIDGKTYNNVQFIEIVPEVLEKLTYPDEDFEAFKPNPDSVLYQNVKKPKDFTDESWIDEMTTPGTADVTTPGTADVTTPGTADGTTPPSADVTTPGTADGTTNTKNIYTKNTNSKNSHTKNENSVCCTQREHKSGEEQIPSKIIQAREIFPELNDQDIQTLLNDSNGDLDCLRRIKKTLDSRPKTIRNVVGWLRCAIKDEYTNHNERYREYERPGNYDDETIKRWLLASSS